MKTSLNNKLKNILKITQKFISMGAFLIQAPTVKAAENNKDPQSHFIFATIDKMETKFQKELAGEFSKLQSLFKKSNSTQNFATEADSAEDEALDGLVELSRINVLIGAFAVLDLKIVEFKIKPYVEMRFDKR